jgi:hypothetical protein
MLVRLIRLIHLAAAKAHGRKLVRDVDNELHYAADCLRRRTKMLVIPL